MFDCLQKTEPPSYAGVLPHHELAAGVEGGASLSSTGLAFDAVPGAKDRMPEINASEIIVDFQWHFPMDVQWHFPMDCHVCDIWCVIFCPGVHALRSVLIVSIHTRII